MDGMKVGVNLMRGLQDPSNMVVVLLDASVDSLKFYRDPANIFVRSPRDLFANQPKMVPKMHDLHPQCNPFVICHRKYRCWLGDHPGKISEGER